MMEETVKSPKAEKRVKRLDTRPTIGLLLEGVGSMTVSSYEADLWRGCMEAAQERDVNLVWFAGGMVAPVFEDLQRNVVYDLATADVVDGLILNAGVMTLVSPEQVRAFCDRYRPLPVVSIGLPTSGVPNVSVDNYTGMLEVIDHLISVHGYRRIAFIGGPEGNLEAQERYRAYVDALAKHGLPFDPDLVTGGDFLPASGAEAVRLLLDQRKVAFEAIVGSNDNMALGAMRELQAHGLRVPHDVAVVGFDDILDAANAAPPLTTVRQPLHQLGLPAVDMLLATIAGEEVPEQVTVPAGLALRQSCGCLDALVSHAVIAPPLHIPQKAQKSKRSKPFEKAFAAQRARVLFDIIQAVGTQSVGVVPGWVEEILDSFVAELEKPSGLFISTLESVLRQVEAIRGDVASWQEAISVLRRHVRPMLVDSPLLARAEDLWQGARVTIAQQAQQAMVRQTLQAEQQAQALREIGQALSTTFDLAALTDILVNGLPRLNITSAYLSLYEGVTPPTEWSRLVMAYNEKGRITLESGGLHFPSRQLIPQQWWPRERRYTLVVEPLYFRENAFGLALFEIGPQGSVVYETLRQTLSSALQGALLVQQVERRASWLQTAAEVSHAAGSILDPDELSHQVVNLIRERFDLYYAGLFLVDQTGEWSGEPGKWAVLRAGTGEAGQKMLEQGHKLEIGGASMIGWCLANKQARIALDVGTEAVRFDNPLLPETRSELALPLISRGEVIGALTIQSTQEAAFSPEDITVLQTMADQLANAIANARLYEALAREQSLMNALMDNVPDYIYFKDRESRFIRTTRAHARMFGLSDPAEVIGKTDFDFFSEEHARQAYEDEQRIIATGEPLLNVEERETWPSRPDTWVSTSKMPLRDENGNIVGTFGISRDITDRKRAEIALERRAIQLQAAAEVAREAVAIHDVGQLLDRTVRLISERFGFYHAGVFLIDEQGEYAILRAASSEGGARMLARGHRLKVGETGIVGFVAATGEPRIALDVGEDAVFFDNPDLPNTRSEMALPLKVRGRVIGVLDVQAIEPAAFTEEDLTVLQTMADQLAIAIDNAALIERTESQLRELNLLYGEYSAAAWARLVGSGRAPGYVYDRIGVMPVTDTALPALDLALERGETVNLVEPEEGGAVLAVPLKVRNQVIGTLGIQATDGSREWSPQEIALVEAVSEQVALALENARLYTESQRTARSMETLYETSRAMSSSLEEETTLRAILEGVYRTLGCEHVLISTVDEETSTIGVRHGIWQGQFDIFPEWIEMARYPLDQPDILTDVYRTGRTEIIAGWDDRFNREIYEKYGHERFLRIFMPIRMRERILGVVEVGYDRQQKERVSDEEVQMLAAFMDQAAVALENTRMFEEARQRARRERQIYEIASKIRRSPDISTILQTAVDELGHALRTDRAVVRLMVKPRTEQ